jgi:hypothetical protein
MQKGLRSSIFILIAAVIILSIFSKVSGKVSDWNVYTGKFISFSIHRDFELKITTKNNDITYTICDPDNFDIKLIIDGSERERKFNLSCKPGYRVDRFDSLTTSNVHRVERKGVNPNGKHWREVFLTRENAGKDLKPGIIYAFYDNIPGETRIPFDRIIDSIEIRQIPVLSVDPEMP